MRQTTEAGFAGDLAPRAVLFFPLVRPMMRCIMAGRRHHPCRGAEADPHGPLTMEITQLQFDMVFSSLLCQLCSSTGAGCGGDSRDPSVASCSSPSCRRLPCRGAEAGFLVLSIHADHRAS